MIDSMPSATFRNKHGEKFVIHSDGITVWMSGDEVNMMVDDKKKIGKYINLFNPVFSVWSKEELFQLGSALMELHRP